MYGWRSHAKPYPGNELYRYHIEMSKSERVGLESDHLGEEPVITAYIPSTLRWDKEYRIRKEEE